MTLIRRFMSDEHGATAIEYALIITFIAIVIVGGATSLGTKVGATFNKVGTGFPSS